MTEPLVTAMVSTYASERYLAGCLDDLLAQTLGDRLEIVVIDAASPEREGELARAYAQRHANVRYLRTEQREGTSAAFRRATAMARGRYLTTANTDDRHHPEFGERLVAVLEQCPQFGLVYADAAISKVDNETWQDTTATQRFRWPDYTPAVALSCCLFGAQPMWRKEAHEEAGPWTDEFPIANDHDVFARIARARRAVHCAEVLGLFLQRPDSNAGSGRAAAVLADACALMKKLRSTWALDEIVPGATNSGPFAMAAAWFEFGNLCALGPYTDAALALDCYRQALALPLPLDPIERRIVQAAFANNSACILLAGGLREPARRAFAACAPGPMRDHNVALLTAVGAPMLRQLRFVELEHPIVSASRSTRSVTVDRRGVPQWSASHEQRPWDVFEGPNGVPWRHSEAKAPCVVG